MQRKIRNWPLLFFNWLVTKVFYLKLNKSCVKKMKFEAKHYKVSMIYNNRTTFILKKKVYICNVVVVNF